MSAKRKQREIAPKLAKKLAAKSRPDAARRSSSPKLKVVAGTDAPLTGTPTTPSPDAAVKKPGAATATRPEGNEGWGGLVKGAVVLATDNPVDGWFPCDVQHADGEAVTLIWQGWPELGKFNRKLTQVALLHPKMVKPC